MKDPKYYGWFTIRGWAVVALAFGLVFGGLGLLIQSEYIADRSRALTVNAIAVVMLVLAAIGGIIWYVKDRG